MASIRSLGFSIFSTYDGSGIRNARRDVDDFSGSTNRSTSAMNSWAGRLILMSKAALIFGPALIPISAQLAATGAAAVAMGASVGVGMAAYGLAMKNAIKSTQEMAKAGKTLSASQKDYIKSQDAYNKAVSNFGSSFRDESLKAASATLRGFTSILKGLEPVAKALAPEVTKVAVSFEKWAKSSTGFKAYIGLIKDSAVPIFRDLVAAGKAVLNVLGDGFRAFLPNGVKLADTLRKGAEALKAWSDGGGFTKFLAYVQKNSGPVKEFFKALGDALTTIGTTMKDLGPFSLTVTMTLLKLVAAMPPSWIEAMVKGFVAWKVAMVAWAAATAVAAAAQFALTLAASPFLLLMAGAALTIGLVVVALAALAVGIYFLVKNWDTVAGAFVTAWNATWNAVKIAVEAVWNALKIAWAAVSGSFVIAWQAVSGALTTAWNAVWNALKIATEAVWNALKMAWEAVIGALATAWTTVSAAIVTAWTTVWNGIKLVAETVWNGLKFLWDSLINGILIVWTAMSTALSTAWSVVWTAIQVVAQAIWTGLQLAWQAFITALQTIWTTVSAALSAAWSAVWTAIQAVAQAVWTALQLAWQTFITALQTIWSTVSAVLSAAWQLFWTALQTAAQAVWTALQLAWQTFITAIQTIWTTFSAILLAAWNLFWNALKTAAQLVWTALQLAWQTFITALQTIWSTVSAALSAAWSTFWNALKTAAQAVWDAIKAAWQAILDGIKQAWETFSGAIKSAWDATWEALRGAAESAWNKIKDVISDAVNGIIKIINGIIGGINKVASAVGLGDIIPEVPDVNFAIGGVVGYSHGGITGTPPTAFARGGVIPGYAPGKDTVNAMLSKGEGILVPEAVRGLGADFVHAANYHFSHGRGGKNVAFPGYASSGGGVPGFADGGVALGGGVQAWHRTGPADGWAFQGGGVIPPTPGVPIGGAGPFPASSGASNDTDILTPGIQSGDDDGGGFLDSLVDIAKDTVGIGDSGVSSMVLGFIGEEVFDKLLDAATAALDGFGMGGKIGEVMVAAARKVIEAAIDFLRKKNEEAKEKYEAMAVAGSQSVQAWAPLAAQALALAGLSPGQLPAFLALMQAESGGNPNAINNTDINAKNGVPSQGLMQVIPPTFAAYHVAGTSNNILDPLANMAASANYIKARYGGQVPGSPYADGTDNATPGLHLVGEEGPELVTSPGYAMFGGGEQVLNAPDTAAAMGGGGDAAAAPAAGGGALAAPSAGGSGAGAVETPDDVYALVQELLESAPQLQKVISAMWAQVVSSSNSGWQTMSGTTFAPLNANLASTIPAGMAVMQAAWLAGMTAVTTGTQAQWTVMDTAAFAPMNAAMSTTIPAAATSMGTQVTEAATTMGTGVTTATGQMQGSVAESWGQMESGTESSWTNIETSISDSVNAATTPINGLLGGFNNVSASLGMGINVPLIAFSEGGMMPAFAGGGMLHKKGGTLPGYAPGKDRIPAMLSPGEGVLTPEAVRGLGGPGFVYAANKKWSGHRGAGKGGPSMQHFAAGGMAMHEQKRLLPGGVPDAHSGRMMFASGTITPQDAAGLAEAGIDPGMVTQGSFSTGVAASAGTHDGDGVVDIGSTSVEAQMRAAGWAAWTRGNGDGMSPHTHGVLMSASGMSPGAMAQVLDYIRGGSGLGAGSAGSDELAGWGLGLGRWDFGPLIKDLVNMAKTDVPAMLRPIILKKLTADQVASGFAEKKAALDAMDVGSGSWADGLRAMGSKSHDGAVNSVASQATSFDRGGWWMPGTYAYNGTSSPELAIPADELEDIANHIKNGGDGSGEQCVHVEFNFNGPVSNGNDVRRAVDEAIPKLRSAVQAGSGSRRVGG